MEQFSDFVSIFNSVQNTSTKIPTTRGKFYGERRSYGDESDPDDVPDESDEATGGECDEEVPDAEGD